MRAPHERRGARARSAARSSSGTTAPTTARAADRLRSSAPSARLAAAALMTRREVEGPGLEDAPEVQELHEGEAEAVLERGMEGEGYEHVFEGGRHRDEPRARLAPRPEPLSVQGKEPGTRGEAAVHLHQPAARPFPKGHRVIGALEKREAVRDEHAEGGLRVVQHEHVHVGHGAIAGRGIEPLGQGRALQGQDAQPRGAEACENARGQVELKRPSDELGPGARAATRPCAASGRAGRKPGRAGEEAREPLALGFHEEGARRRGHPRKRE